MRSKRRSKLRVVLILLVLSLGSAGGYVGGTSRHLALATVAYWRRDWDGTQRHAAAHLRGRPNSMQAMLLLARGYRGAGDMRSAVRIYEGIGIDRVPLYDLPGLDNYYHSTSQTGNRILVCQAIRQHQPDNVENLFALAVLYQDLNNHYTAIGLFEQVTQLQPDRVSAWAHRYLSHLSLGEHQKAADCLRKAITLKPPQVWKLHKTLGDILVSSLGSPHQAQEHLQAALAENPNDPEALCFLAQCFLERNPPDKERARHYVGQALKLNGRDRGALLALARLDLADGDWKAALSRVDQILQERANDRDALHLRQICLTRKEDPSVPFSLRKLVDAEMPVTWQFTEVAAASGVAFRHSAGENKEKRYFPETLGSGVALLDYDGDGRLDLYFVTFNQLVPADPSWHVPARNLLYRNRGNGLFQDVTATSGLGLSTFGHGVAVGDYDNDGDPDVYLANYGPNNLLRNNGDGTFTDVTASAGVADYPNSMSTSAAWFDYNEDGALDLYVCNYTDYDVANPLNCRQPGVGLVYCGPDSLGNQRHTLFRNNGDGTFTDVTDAMGIGRNDAPQKGGKGLGVVAADLNGDGHVDLYVANDTTPNFLFWGDGTKLVDGTEASWAHVNREGNNEASMGVDAGDVDGDGRPELFVTNQWGEKNTLYRNEGGLFLDATDLYGMAQGTRRKVGWGTALVDFDNDGDLDNFVTNGHFYDWREPAEQFRQTAMLWKNGKRGVFEDVSAEAGPYFQEKVVGRGAAFGDLDNDGDVDIVLNHWNEPCAVLRNDTKTAGTWIRLDLVGVESNRDAVGAAIEVHAGNSVLYYQRKGGGSYLSANDPRLLIGLGQAAAVDRLRIRWPSGQVRVFHNLPANQAYRLIEGQEPRPLQAGFAVAE